MLWACLSLRAMLDQSRHARLDHPASEARPLIANKARPPTRSETLPLTTSKARPPAASKVRPQTTSEARPLFTRKARPPQRAYLVHSRQARLDHQRRAESFTHESEANGKRGLSTHGAR
eukprot:2739756-Pleurochrysis_carterae.AAC.1